MQSGELAIEQSRLGKDICLLGVDLVPRTIASHAIPANAQHRLSDFLLHEIPTRLPTDLGMSAILGTKAEPYSQLSRHHLRCLGHPRLKHRGAILDRVTKSLLNRMFRHGPEALPEGLYPCLSTADGRSVAFQSADIGASVQSDRKGDIRL